MNSKLVTLLLSCAGLLAPSTAFVVKPTCPQRSISTSLQGFTDGRAPRITIREDEDAAMWIDEKPAKSPAKKPEAKKPAAKAPAAKKVEAKKAPASGSKPTAGGFKFPWEK